MTTWLGQFLGTVTAKVLFIGVLVLALLIPMRMIEGLILERMQRYEAARAGIADVSGAQQTIGGPILVLPYEFTHTRGGQSLRVSDELYLLPEALELAGDVQVSELRRGIYRVPVYEAVVRVTGRFPNPMIDADLEELELLWSQAHFALPLSEPRAIREPVRINVGEGAAQFEPASQRVPGFGQQLVARFADLGAPALDSVQTFSVELRLRGTGTLRFLPLGDTTSVSLTSNWSSPSFTGAYLPDDREVTDTGFAASWRILALGRGYPGGFRQSNVIPPQSLAVSIEQSAFGVSLIVPVGVHEASLRAAKYAVLLIGLSFGAYFLFEIFVGLRLHLLQYLLIGMANCVFYLLLLALAEHVGFGWAYVSSAVASTVLIGAYSAAVLGSLGRALPIAALLAAMYGYLYVTLRAEDYALLFGALGVFAALAAFMFMTRRVDWHRVTFGHDRRLGDEVRA